MNYNEIILFLNIVFLAFVLGTPKRTYIFIAPTIKEKKTWEKLLHERIAVEKERFLEVAVVDVFIGCF